MKTDETWIPRNKSCSRVGGYSGPWSRNCLVVAGSGSQERPRWLDKMYNGLESFVTNAHDPWLSEADRDPLACQVGWRVLFGVYLLFLLCWMVFYIVIMFFFLLLVIKSNFFLSIIKYQKSLYSSEIKLLRLNETITNDSLWIFRDLVVHLIPVGTITN